MNIQQVGQYILAIITIGFVGVYALLYPTTSNGTLALGALIAIAGSIGTHFFNSVQNSFLGNQLAAQRAGFVAAITSSPTTGVTTPTLPNSVPSTSSTGTASNPPSNP